MKEKRYIIITLIIAIVLLGFSCLNGENYEKFTIKANGNKAIINGVINTDTPEVITSFIEKHPEVKTIVFDNCPGSMDDEANLKVCRYIRIKGLNTHVPSTGIIASGATDMFCAGVKRTVEENATIGVHSWATDEITDASKLPKTDPQHKLYLDYYKEMGIPTDFYWFTLNAADGNNIYNMSMEELKKYKLIN